MLSRRPSSNYMTSAVDLLSTGIIHVDLNAMQLRVFPFEPPANIDGALVWGSEFHRVCHRCHCLRQASDCMAPRSHSREDATNTHITACVSDIRPTSKERTNLSSVLLPLFAHCQSPLNLSSGARQQPPSSLTRKSPLPLQIVACYYVVLRLTSLWPFSGVKMAAH